MINSIQLYGRVNSKGKPAISGNDRFMKIFEDNADKMFIIEVTILEKGTVDSYVWYIIKVIVPAVIKGNIEAGNVITQTEALDELIESCPIMQESARKRHSLFNWNTYTPDCKLSKEELLIAIEWMHIYCLENFDIVIGNIKTI